MTMDNASIFYRAAANGDLHTLQTLAALHSMDEIQTMVSATTDGQTPLITACRNNRVAVAEYLLDECGADIEQGGSVEEEELTVDGATPLWFAAAEGHLRVMRSLLRRGANANCQTPLCPPPLVDASSGERRMVRLLLAHGADVDAADAKGTTALMTACFWGNFWIAKHLIGHAANVMTGDLDDHTALHYATKQSKFKCLKLLLRYGAEIDEISNKLTPLLLVRRTELPPNDTYLIIFPFCTRLPLGDLELLGASYVDAFRHERFTWPYRRRSVERDPAGGYRTRVMEWDRLGGGPTPPDSQLRLDAIQITKTVAGPSVYGAKCYYSYGGHINVNNNYAGRVISMWNLSVELHRTSVTTDRKLVRKTVCSFADLFVKMMGKHRPPPYEVVMAVFIVASRGIEVDMPDVAFDDTNFDRKLASTVDLVFFLVHLRPSMTPQHRQLLVRLVRGLVRLFPRDSDGRTPLHLACSSSHAFDAVQLLLDVGACPRAVDDAFNSPLHVLARRSPPEHQLIQLLLSRGAHFDGQNVYNHRFIDYLPENDHYQPFDYVNLQCLAANAITTHNINYEARLPPLLAEFVNLH